MVGPRLRALRMQRPIDIANFQSRLDVDRQGSGRVGRAGIIGANVSDILRAIGAHRVSGDTHGLKTHGLGTDGVASWGNPIEAVLYAIVGSSRAGSLEPTSPCSL